MNAISSCEDMTTLQSDLNNVMKWSERNNMYLHQDKFEYMSHFHTANRANNLQQVLPFTSEVYQYTSSKGSLRPVEKLKDLGVVVTSEISWSTHANAMADKARRKAGWILSIYHTRSPTIMLTL